MRKITNNIIVNSIVQYSKNILFRNNKRLKKAKIIKHIIFLVMKILIMKVFIVMHVMIHLTIVLSNIK